MKTRPFLRWAGGKQKIVNSLLENAPSHNLINDYYEPFLGAGSLFFSNGFSKGVISDVNSDLVNAYNQIKNNYISVDRNLKSFNKNFKKNKDFYYQIRSDFNSHRNQSSIIQASRFIFLIHTNYNGMYRLNRKGEYNVPVGKIKPCIPNFEHLKSVSDKLENVEIRCSSYENILLEVQPRDFIYLDPPYPPYDWANQQNQYTLNKFTKENHEEVSKFANELSDRGCYVMISYPDIDFVRDKYELNWNIEELNIFRSISCKKERKVISELIIKNY
jgi:DNA adenine methylase